MTGAPSLFARMDRRDAAALAELFAQDATVTIGNREPIAGHSAVATGSAAFLTSIAGLCHRIINQWVVWQDTIAETMVTYTRHDGSTVTIPTVSIWRAAADGLITNYRVFVDLAPVLAP